MTTHAKEGFDVGAGVSAGECTRPVAGRLLLWNAVEDAEKSKDSRLAREFVVALPRELNPNQQITLLTEYSQQQFVADGMCADVGIHNPDPPGHNPHAHILLTIRPLDEQPTIHEGVAARAVEKKGVISDRCELNRQIKADNALLREKLIVVCYQIKRKHHTSITAAKQRLLPGDSSNGNVTLEKS